MTAQGDIAHNNERRRKDNNRERHVAAVTSLQRLLAIASDPDFRGTVALEITAKDGLIGSVKTTHVEFR